MLQAERPVTRGTLQAVCTHQPFDEARRLGLPTEEEAGLVSSFDGDPDTLGVAESWFRQARMRMCMCMGVCMCI